MERFRGRFLTNLCILCVEIESRGLASVQTPLVSFLCEGGANKMHDPEYKADGG